MSRVNIFGDEIMEVHHEKKTVRLYLSRFQGYLGVEVKRTTTEGGYQVKIYFVVETSATEALAVGLQQFPSAEVTDAYLKTLGFFDKYVRWYILKEADPDYSEPEPETNRLFSGVRTFKVPTVEVEVKEEH
jgi:hypothetical protein